MGKQKLKPRFFNFNGRNYQVENWRAELTQYLGFSHVNSHFPTNHWEMTIIVLYAPMQYGKSELMKNICLFGKEIYEDTFGFEAYKTNDLLYAVDTLNKNVEKRRKVLFLCFDDAMGQNAKGTNSLRTMSNENVDSEKLLSELRHALRLEDNKGKCQDERVKNGYCVLIYAIQSLRRLSTFIRDNATFNIYKCAWKQLESEMSEEDFMYLEDITEDSDKHIYEARASALAITKSGRSMRLYFPMCDFKYDGYLINDGSWERYKATINELKRYKIVGENPMPQWYLKAKIEEIAEMDGIIIKSTDMMRIIRKAKMQKMDEINEEANAHSINMQEVHNLRLRGDSYDTIIAKLGLNINRYKLSRLYKKWCIDKHITIIKNANTTREVIECHIN